MESSLDPPFSKWGLVLLNVEKIEIFFIKYLNI